MDAHRCVCVCSGAAGSRGEGACTLLAAAQLPSLSLRYLLSPTITEGRSDGCGGAEESAGPPAPAEVRARVMNFSSSSMSSPMSERERRMRKGGEP